MSVLSRASSTLRSGFQAIPLNPARQALLDTTIQTIQRRGGPLTAKELKALSKQLDPWSVVKIQNYIDARLHSLDHDNGFTELNQQEEGFINNIYTSTSITIATPPPSQYSPPVPHYPAPPPPPSPELEPSGSSLVGFFNDLDDTLFLAMATALYKGTSTAKGFKPDPHMSRIQILQVWKEKQLAKGQRKGGIKPKKSYMPISQSELLSLRTELKKF